MFRATRLELMGLGLQDKLINCLYLIIQYYFIVKDFIKYKKINLKDPRLEVRVEQVWKIIGENIL